MNNFINPTQVSRRSPVPKERLSSGIGYIIIPSDIDREIFIQSCQFAKTISLITETSERIDNVLVAAHIWNDIIFPPTPNIVGSCVFWNNIPKMNQVVAVGVIEKKDELTQINEKEFRISREDEGAIINIIGDVKEGKLTIEVDTITKKEEDLGEITIKVNTGGKQGKLKLISDGAIFLDSSDTKIIASEEFSFHVQGEKDKKYSLFSYKRGSGLSFIDEFGNELKSTENGFQLLTNKFLIGEEDGSEYSVLGESLYKLLSSFIDTIAQSTVMTALGQQPLINKIDILALKDNLPNIISKLTYTN